MIRTTNLVERLFLGERRRTKIIPHAFGERPVSKRMYAAVIRAPASKIASGVSVATVLCEFQDRA